MCLFIFLRRVHCEHYYQSAGAGSWGDHQTSSTCKVYTTSQCRVFSLVTSHIPLVAMFGSLILRNLSTGPALAEVVVMGGGLMGTGIAQV